MPYLVILKRFEVWLLLLVVAALILFAIQSGDEPDLPGGPTHTQVDPLDPAIPSSPKATIPEPDQPTETLVIQNVHVDRTQGGQIVETTLFGRSPNAESLRLDEPHVKATTSEGEPVHQFFEPFKKTAMLLTNEDSSATLRWWVEGNPTSLWIEVAGQQLEAALP